MLRLLYKRIKDRVTKRYRVELIDDVTLSQSRQYFVKPISIALLIGVLFIGIVGGTILTFVYTPKLHALIPNYENPEVIQQREDSMSILVTELERKFMMMEAYGGSFKKIAGFDQDSLPEFDEAAIEEARIDRGEMTQAQLEAAFKEKERELQEEDQDLVSSGVGTPSSVVRVAQRKSSYPKNSEMVLAKLFPPLIGQISNPYDEGSLHYGVDIVADENTLIKSIADGFVVISEYSNENGWIIGVASPGNVVAFYKHNSRLLKTAGTYVYAGEPIAVIGNSGENSTGTHLHLEIWRRGKPLNPADYINLD
ncbi:MAG: M23 family metallopeptidase [Bacteroidota bacterium]